MRRRSIVGPLLLIGLGALFLANSLDLDLPLFRLVAIYWPFLLIAWGGLRLIEILALAAFGKPYPRGIGGGEIALLVLICLMGSGMYSFHQHFGDTRVRIGPWGPRTLEIFGEEHEYPINAESAAAGVRRLVVEHGRGNVRITGGDGAALKIAGRKIVRAYDNDAAAQADRRTPVEIEIQGERAIVRANLGRAAGNVRVSADLEIAAPRGLAVEVRNQTGDIELVDVGAVLVDSDNAGVRIQKAAGDVRVDARRSDVIRAVDVKGNVEIESRGSDLELEKIAGDVRIRGSYSGTLEFENLAKPLTFESRQTELRVASLPGRITMDLARFNGEKLVGPVRFVTRSRDVQVADFSNSLEIDTDRGDVEIKALRTPLARIEARSRSGNIRIALPEKAAFQLDATTDSGEAHNDFGASIQVSSDGPSASMKGAVGNGPLVKLSTGRGSIAVRKAEGQLQETNL
jgi:hypothetical protein